MSNVVQLRVDAKIKKKVANIFADLGLDLSTGVKIYFQQVLRHGGIPFSLLTDNGFTPKEEETILRESRETLLAYTSGKLHTAKNWQEAKKEILAG
ncbi:MAG: type II toxin-antitoxin system RelB/DinJ family antitoxin [Candidatus Magasanikbacteria bacterium]|nr:type II toxin-antitoxin system RelB/DinJ family antitoxin [Candidatus Magasanikbacteria bacterium]